jgi:ribosomal protein S18 acetylase RimI-like enzyme
MILSTPDPALDLAFGAALLRLQHEAYGRQADIIGSRGLRSLEADDDSLPAWRGRYLVAWNGTQLVGAVAWRESSDGMEVDRVMVDPAAHRQGIASRLLTALTELAGAGPIRACTASANTPGMALYERFGFEPEGEDESPSGVQMTHLRRG